MADEESDEVLNRLKVRKNVYDQARLRLLEMFLWCLLFNFDVC